MMIAIFPRPAPTSPSGAKRWAVAALLSLFLVGPARAQDAESVSPCRDEPFNTTIEYGDHSICSIAFLGDVDLFRFQGTEGDLIRISISRTSNFSANPQFELLDSQGKSIHSPVVGPFSNLTIALPSSGVFTILVTERSNSNRFDYVLSLYRIRPRSAETRFICDGCVSSAKVDPVGDFDLYTFRASVGDVVAISLARRTNIFATPQVEVYDPAGERIKIAQGSGFSVRLEIEDAGEYTVLTGDRSNNETYDYNLALQCLGGPCLQEPESCQLSQPASDIALSGGAITQEGTRLLFQYSVLNHGEAVAEGVVLRNTFPPGLTVEEIAPGCTVAGRVATCDLGDLAPQQRFAFLASLRLLSEFGGELRNEATLTLREGACDPDLVNNVLVLRQDIGNAPPAPTQEFIFPQVANGRAGSVEFQTALLLSNKGDDSRVDLDFVATPGGSPLNVNIVGFGQGSFFSFLLPRGESVTLETDGTGTLQSGYVRVRAAEGVSGVAVFSRTDLTFGVPLFETGVPISKPVKEFHLLVDSRGARDTGLAMVYPEGASFGEDANITMRLYDQTYRLVGQTQLTLPPGGHIARFVNEFFADPQIRAMAMEMQGILTVDSSQPLAAVTLRQTDSLDREYPDEVPFLTTFPVIPGRPEQ